MKVAFPSANDVLDRNFVLRLHREYESRNRVANGGAAS